MDMPSLHEVCVWEGFSPDSIDVSTEGSPNVCFQTDCNGDCTVEIILTVPVDTLYQPDYIEATSSEDGMIYLVPEETDKNISVIRGACIDSVEAIANTPVNVPLSSIEENGVYWLYARDSSGNISELEAFTIMGVSVENRKAEEIKIYPNPTSTLLNINSTVSGLYYIEITSLNGQLLFSKEMQGTTHQLDLSSFQKGIYFITIRSKDYVTTRKIIKLSTQ
jgi:hypothetical protein